MKVTVEQAAKAFVQSLFAAKENCKTEAEFFEDRAINNSYDQLFKAIDRSTPKEVKWSSGFWDFATSYGYAVWKGEAKVDTAVQDFTNALIHSLDNLSVVEWIACVPLERAFCRFPEFTSFGDFAVVNIQDDEPVDEGNLLAKFRSILSENCSVCFMQTTEVTDSYLHLGDHYYHKSSNYIPGRPQLILNVGKGESSSNERILRKMAQQLLPLLQFCQVIVEQASNKFILTVVRQPTRLPDRKTYMPFGLLPISPVAVAINKRTGQCDWWVTDISIHENNRGVGYDPTEFVDTWKSIIEPIISIQKGGLSGKIRDALDNAIQLIAACRHREFGDLILNSVIATETLLNPFNNAGELSERFALFSSILRKKGAAERKLAYHEAKNLYRIRCHAVHRGQKHDEDNRSELEKQALSIFISCVQAIVAWAKEMISEDKVIDKDSFDEFYIRTMLGG